MHRRGFLGRTIAALAGLFGLAGAKATAATAATAAVTPAPLTPTQRSPRLTYNGVVLDMVFTEEVTQTSVLDADFRDHRTFRVKVRGLVRDSDPATVRDRLSSPHGTLTFEMNGAPWLSGVCRDAPRVDVDRVAAGSSLCFVHFTATAEKIF